MSCQRGLSRPPCRRVFSCISQKDISVFKGLNLNPVQSQAIGQGGNPLHQPAATRAFLRAAHGPGRGPVAAGPPGGGVLRGQQRPGAGQTRDGGVRLGPRAGRRPAGPGSPHLDLGFGV